MLELQGEGLVVRDAWNGNVTLTDRQALTIGAILRRPVYAPIVNLEFLA